MKLLPRLHAIPAPALLTLALAAPSPAGVIINEVFYHAPGDRTEVQYVELFNASDSPADLGGWRFSKGIQYVFPAGARLEPGSYLVLCKDREAFKGQYEVPPAGVFEGSLGRGGDEIELRDSSGGRVDAVKYEDRAPWPTAPDGYSASLERISPLAGSDLPHNWAPSPLSGDGAKPGGTPGKRNASHCENLPPRVGDLRVAPESPAPGQALSVEASIEDPDGVGEVRLAYRLAASGQVSEESAVAMTPGPGGRYTAEIPGQKAGHVIRFRIEAADRKGAKRWHPSPNEPRPAFSRYVLARPDLARIPGAIILNLGKSEFEAARRIGRGSRGAMADPGTRKRWMAGMTIQTGLDLEAAWWELVFTVGVDPEQARKLGAVFTAKVAERQKLIDDVSEAEDIDARVESLPRTIESLQAQLKEAVSPPLNEEQRRKFSEWQGLQAAAGRRERGFPGGMARMLRQFIDLEGALLALSTRASFTEAQLGKLKSAFQDASAERGKFAQEAEAAMRGGGDFGRLQEKVGAFQEGIDKKIAAELTADQQRHLDGWRSEHTGPPWARGRRRAGATPPQGNHAFVSIDPRTGQAELFDFVNVTPRSGGFKVRFHKDQPLKGMTTINLLFEYLERFVLAEPLAYELYRKAGNAASTTDFVRLHSDDRALGYYLLVEQPNRSFLRRNRLREDGNLYKILWYERGVVGQHEKKTNVHSGHDDIVQLVDLLKRTRGDEQWAVIKKHFDVEQVINYFAANTCLSHWDGFFNNYFTYHDVRGTGKWTMYPWDQDKTWGFYDGLERGEVFHDMPITFGMEGDSPPGGRGSRSRGGPFGGTSWWRPGGHFSAPLLANPQFRKLFLARTKEVLEQVYTEEVFLPVIAELESRLKPEIPLRAKLVGDDPDQALERFEQDLRSFRDHLVKRREFLLAQEEIRGAGRFDRSALK